MKQARYAHIVLKSLIPGDEECGESFLEDEIEDFFIFTNEEVGTNVKKIYSGNKNL